MQPAAKNCKNHRSSKKTHKGRRKYFHWVKH